MICTSPVQLAPAYSRQDNQSGQDEHRLEHSRLNQPDALLNVPQNWREAERSKCGGHQPAQSVPIVSGESFQLQQ